VTRTPRRLTALAAAVTVLALPAVAAAVAGPLTYRGCIANNGDDGCEQPPHNSLGNNVDLATSADGSSVYVAAVEGTLTRLTTDITGDLVYDTCFAHRSRHGCRAVPHDSLKSATGVAVSPDGSSVYVTSAERTNAITRFKLRPGKGLEYRSCIANGGRRAGNGGCAKPPRNSLDGNEAIAISPGGTSAYVASSDSDSITRFRRSPNGALIYRGCFANDGAHGCRNAKHDSLGGAFDVVVSPDGQSVYVASLRGDAITRFDRRQNGALIYRGCFADGGAHGCRDLPHDSLGGADALAVSPDGESVYVAALRANAITAFQRSPGGSLVPGGCIANSGAHGCQAPPQDSLHAANGLAVSPDDDSVVATAMSGPTVNGGPGAVSWFDRRFDGSLGPRGCFADGGKHDCRPPRLDSVGSPESVAVSPGGGSVYVGSFGRALSIFTRVGAVP
jgi:DNA-binding beta-propeller fold protein YncE